MLLQELHFWARFIFCGWVLWQRYSRNSVQCCLGLESSKNGIRRAWGEWGHLIFQWYVLLGSFKKMWTFVTISVNLASQNKILPAKRLSPLCFWPVHPRFDFSLHFLTLLSAVYLAVWVPFDRLVLRWPCVVDKMLKSNYRLTSIWYDGHTDQWTILIFSGTKVYRHNRICVNFKVWKLDVYITWIYKLAQNVAVSAGVTGTWSVHLVWKVLTL